MNELLDYGLDMLKAERQATILQTIGDRGFVKSDELMEQLDISHVTLRRDLVALAQQNLINLEHGGATRIDYLDGIAEPLYDTKLYVHSEAKNRMAELGVSLIRDGDILIIDSGTTNYRLAQRLKMEKFTALTVITSDIMVAKELSPHPHISVLLLGGLVRRSYYNVYGPFTEMILSSLKANKVFIGFDGASVSRGLSLNLLEEVPVKQKMIEICDEIIAFGDSGKFGKDSPFHVCGWDKITHAIVEAEPSIEYRELFAEKKITLISP